MKLETYKASDRRVYNGDLCSDMAKEFKHEATLSKRMRKADPTASCTYFPMEDKYLVFTTPESRKNPGTKRPPIQLTGNFHENKQEALIEAIIILEKRSTST